MVLYSAYRDFARGFSQISSYNIAIFLSVVFGDCAQGAAGLPVSKALLLQFLIAHALSLHNRTSMQSHKRDPTENSHGVLPICLVSSLAAGRSPDPAATPTNYRRCPLSIFLSPNFLTNPAADCHPCPASTPSHPDCPLPIRLFPAAGRLFPAAGCLFPMADHLFPAAGPW